MHVWKIALSVALLLGIPGIASAQLSFDIGGFDDTEAPLTAFSPEHNTTLRVVPERPRAGQPLYATIESFIDDLNRAAVNWYVNDELVSSGVGIKELSTTAGAVGEITTIRADITTINGIVFSKTAQLGVAEIDIIWEADSYTPPLYQGKALFPMQGSARVVALPTMFSADGRALGPEEIIFTWEQDGDVQGLYSGLGKNTYTVERSVLNRNVDLRVIVESFDGSAIAEERILIPTIRSEVIMYEESPLLGIVFDQALTKNTELSAEEMQLRGIPYFFSGNERSDNTEFVWRVGSQRIETTGIDNTITLRRGNAGSGVTISLDVQSMGDILQNAESDFRMTFPE